MATQSGWQGLGSHIRLGGGLPRKGCICLPPGTPPWGGSSQVPHGEGGASGCLLAVCSHLQSQPALLQGGVPLTQPGHGAGL